MVKALRKQFASYVKFSVAIMRQTNRLCLITKFETRFTIMGQKIIVRRRPCRSLKNIATVKESVGESLGTSIRHRGQELNISRSTMQRILVKDLHLHAHKVQLVQEIKLKDQA